MRTHTHSHTRTHTPTNSPAGTHNHTHKNTRTRPPTHKHTHAPRGSDREVTADSLAKAIRSYMNHVGSNNLVRLFADLRAHTSWNSAPTRAIEPLAALEPFYRELFAVCRNGMIPRKGLRLALAQVESDQFNHVASYRWNFANRPLKDAAEELGETMRKGASKLRGLKMDCKLYANSMKGASALSRTLIDKILACLIIERVPGNDCRLVEHTGDILDNCVCKIGIFNKFLGGDVACEVTDLGTPLSSRSFVEPPNNPPPVRPRYSSDGFTCLRHDETTVVPRSTTKSSMVPARVFTSPGSCIAQSINDNSPFTVELVTTVDPPQPRNPLYATVHRRIPSQISVRSYNTGSSSWTPTSSVKQRGKEPRRNGMRRASKAEFKKAHHHVHSETTSRSLAKIAYKAAGEHFVGVN